LKKATIPVISRLQSLQTASRLAPGGARVIADAASSDQLTALLREVNETVLGRSLQFETDGGASLALDVAGRRVLRLTAVSGLANAEACLAAEVLEDQFKDDLIKLFQALAVPMQELRVVSGPMSRGGEGMSVGLPVALLADLLLVELNALAGDPVPPRGRTSVAAPAPVLEPDQPPARASLRSRLKAAVPVPVAVAQEAAQPVRPSADAASVAAGGGGFLAAFAAAMGDGMMAWLIVGGATDGTTFGPEEMVSHLNGFLDSEGAALDRQLDQMSDAPGGPVCLVLGAALTEGHSLLVARAEGGVLLGVTEGDATSPVLKAWNAVRG
jgi:hypothetical protein